MARLGQHMVYGKMMSSNVVGGHPLKNPDSTHYRLPGGMESIDAMEKLFTVDELMAWAKINSWKYRLRLGKKDSADKDIGKMQDYENYYEYLKGVKCHDI